MVTIKVGLVGCGAIGQAILRAADQNSIPGVSIIGVSSRTRDSAEKFLKSLTADIPWTHTDSLIQQADLIVEAAGPEVVAGLAEDVFRAGKNLMVISVGALIARPDLIDKSRVSGSRLIIPSGAIVGLDGIKAAAMGSLDRVTLVSRKGPAALAGAPHVLHTGVDLYSLEEETELFFGSATDACVAFPNNLNVSAAVAFAGIGPERTTVKMIAVPGLTRNCHDVEVEGEFGQLRIHLENNPSDNPKTGKLTSMSIIRTLRQAADTVQIGT